MGAIDVWAQIATPTMAARPWVQTVECSVRAFQQEVAPRDRGRRQRSPRRAWRRSTRTRARLALIFAKGAEKAFEQLEAERDEPARQIAAARVQAVEDATGSGARSDS